MSKTNGLGDNLYVGGYNISGDVGAVTSITTPKAVFDFTTIDKSAMVRKGGRRDGSIAFTSFFNSATDQAHPKLSALPTADVIGSYFRGTVQGNPAASLVAKQIGYDPTRADDGALTLNSELQANGYGLEWGVMLTAGVQSDSTATDSASLDQAAQSTNGAQAYLHVFSFTGTSCTISIEDSADDSAWASLIAFTAATGKTSERKTVSGTVDRYVRVSTSGTFTECSFAVVFKRNSQAVVF